MPSAEATPKTGLVISGEKFEHFDTIEFTKSIDTFSTLSFTAPFEPDRKEFRKRFRPFSYSSVNGLIDDKVRFTGEMLTPEPSVDPESASVAVSCYSLPAVLGDCCPPGVAFPLEFSGMTLQQIAQTICNYFGITAKYDATVSVDESAHAFTKAKIHRGPRGGRGKRGNKFARCALEPGDQAHEFLVKLAQQIGLVMSDDEVGNLVFRDSDATLGDPVARLAEGEQPLVSVKANFRPQEYFSEITAFVPERLRKKGMHHSEFNPFTRGTQIRRPHCFKLDSLQTPADAPAACWAKMGRMLGSCASWTIDGLPTWRGPSGDLWTPNTTILVKAPHAWIFDDYEFLIRDVTLHQDKDVFTASLNVVMPGAFSGAMPESLPWD